MPKAPARRSAADEYFTFGLASRRTKPEIFKGFHRHNEIEIGFIERGWMSVIFSRGRIVFGAGQLHVFWGAMPHRNIDAAPGTILHWLTIPLAWFLEWRLPPAVARPLLDGAVLIDKNRERAAADARQFEQWHADLKSNSTDSRKVVLLEAEARLRRLRPMLGAGGRGGTDEPAIGPAGASVAQRPGASVAQLGKVEQIAAYIAAHYREPLRVAEIAASAGLHPDYAVTLFRKTCGMGLVDYVTQHRVSHAQRLLATTEMKILDIAFESGFGSASRFYTAFEELCRQSPKEYRNAMKAEGGRQ